jgi:hypothetical protein
MNGDDKNLLADVLGEATPTGFRDKMLAETLRVVRCRRRRRQTRRTTALLAVLALCGIFIQRDNLSQKPVVSKPATTAGTAEKSYTLVETQPLPASDIVTNQPLASGEFIASTANIKIVQTRTGNYRVINDDELLALLGTHPAVLIRTGPHSEELVFADPKDQTGFPLN